MKPAAIFLLLFYFASTSCNAQDEKNYIFFLHQRFLEQHSLEEMNPNYGKAEYLEILQAFEQAGFEVISEKRRGDVNAREYATKVVKQIDSLLARGVTPSHITVIGTSKGAILPSMFPLLRQTPS